MQLKESTLANEGPLKTSQFIKIPLFLSGEEMSEFLHFLSSSYSDLAFYDTHSVVLKNQGIYDIHAFLILYRSYIETLKNNEIPENRTYHALFSSSLSVTSDIFYQIDVDSERRIIKAKRPIIQLQPHQMTFSSESSSLYSMTYSENSISFGIQLSYPLLFQDPKTHEVIDIDESPLFPNTTLFKKMRIWIREQTLPTPFLINNQKINFPIRLGKQCFSWINTHPQLQREKLYVNQRNS